MDPYVDAAVKDRVGGDEGKVLVFHAGSRFDPDAVTRAAEMMARDDEVDSKVSPGEGSAGPRGMAALRDSSTAKSKKGAGLGSAGLGEGEGSNGGVLGGLRGWMRRRETSEERAFRAWLKKRDTGEVRAATAARRLLAIPGRDGRSKKTKSPSRANERGSKGGWTCVIVGENARVADEISRAVADTGTPCASVVNRAPPRGGEARESANDDEECAVKRARAADVKLMSRARHVVATEHDDGVHVADLLRRCARDAA